MFRVLILVFRLVEFCGFVVFVFGIRQDSVNFGFWTDFVLGWFLGFGGF